jgi:hypothetical protein
MRGRICIVYLLIKVACLVKKVNNIFVQLGFSLSSWQKSSLKLIYKDQEHSIYTQMANVD